MKTWIKRTLIGLFGAGLLAGGCVAFAHRHAHHAFAWGPVSAEDAARMKARMVERVGHRLDLDEAQKAKLGLVADRLREQREALVAGSADPRADLRALIAGPAFDRDKASALVTAKTQAVQTASPALLTALADFYDSLKPEQQAQVRRFLERGRHG